MRFFSEYLRCGLGLPLKIASPDYKQRAKNVEGERKKKKVITWNICTECQKYSNTCQKLHGETSKGSCSLLVLPGQESFHSTQRASDRSSDARANVDQKTQERGEGSAASCLTLASGVTAPHITDYRHIDLLGFCSMSQVFVGWLVC